MITKAHRVRKRTQQNSNRANVTTTSDSDFSDSENDEINGGDQAESEINSESETASSNESTTMLTRSRRKVKAINYSDEHYYTSRGVTEDAKRKKKDSLDDEKKKKILKVSNFVVDHSEIEHNIRTRSQKNNANKKKRAKMEMSESSTIESESNSSSSNNEDVPTGRRSQRIKRNIKNKRRSVYYDVSDNDEEFMQISDIGKSEKKIEKPPVKRQVIRDVLVVPKIPVRKYSKKFIEAHLSWCTKCGNEPNKSVTVYCETCSFTFHIECFPKPKKRIEIIQCKQCLSSNSNCIECKMKGLTLEYDNNSNIGEVEAAINKKSETIDIKEINSQQSATQDTENTQNKQIDEVNSKENLENQDKIDKMQEDNIEKKMEYYQSEWTFDNNDEKTKETKESTASMELDDKKEEENLVINSPSNDQKTENTEHKELEFREYLVKFEDLSYRNVDWVPEEWLKGVASIKFRNFIKLEPDPLPIENVIHKDWTKVDRVLDVEYRDGSTLRDLLNRVTFKKKNKRPREKTKIKSALIKWKGMKYSESNWEDIDDLDSLELKDALETRINAYNIEPVDEVRDTEFVEITKQPNYLEHPKYTKSPFSRKNPNPKYENKLKKYQLDGLK
ncbi:10269_t:CDS:2 [Diversispora eburnea]|uniref:10269_t:CDS:1 n=1 Tax=Diversispora eburnea TaxID=1213867 RepID=A0A9N8VUW0_9GLOM|nr:10269_t:CDS:2 [Diversispora eburnea]